MRNSVAHGTRPESEDARKALKDVEKFEGAMKEGIELARKWQQWEAKRP